MSSRLGKVVKWNLFRVTDAPTNTEWGDVVNLWEPKYNGDQAATAIFFLATSAFLFLILLVDAAPSSERIWIIIASGFAYMGLQVFPGPEFMIEFERGVALIGRRHMFKKYGEIPKDALKEISFQSTKLRGTKTTVSTTMGKFRFYGDPPDWFQELDPAVVKFLQT